MKKNKICKNCLNKFNTNNPIKIYCNFKCNKKYNQKEIMRKLKEYKKTKEKLKICPICQEDFITNKPNKIYCSNECNVIYYQGNNYYKENQEYFKNYRQKNREKIKLRDKTYCQEHKEETKERKKKYEYSEKGKLRRKKYNQDNQEQLKKLHIKWYNKNKGKNCYKLRVREYQKIRRTEDKDFAIKSRLRSLVKIALKRYTKTGKIMKSRDYFIDYQAIVDCLKPFPENLKDYEIHHIKPLFTFDFINEDGSTNLEEVKKAFSPENHKLLLKDEHRKLNHFKLM